MQAITEQLRKMEEEIAASKPSEVEGKVATMDSMKTNYTNLEKTAAEMCEAMEFMLQESRTVVRAGQLQNKYKVSKVVWAVGAGRLGQDSFEGDGCPVAQPGLLLHRCHESEQA